jgi:hypothetical protein
MLFTRLAISVSMACILLATLAGLASANNFAGDQAGFTCSTAPANEVCLADSSHHTFFKDVGPNYSAAIDATLNDGWAATTVLTVGPAAEAHGGTDAYYFYSNLGGGLLGQVNCLTLGPNPGRCIHFHVELDVNEAIAQGWGDGSGFDQNRLQAIACHETGHTLGLFHVTGGSATTYHCMRNTTTANFETVPSTIGPHNRAHIDGFY